MEKTELKELVRQGETEKALFELGKILDKNNTLYDELIILWKRHDDIGREIRLGTISFQESSIENNKVTDSLLKLINNIEKPKIIDKITRYIHVSGNKNISNKKENKIVPVEDAIDFLCGVLLNQRILYQTRYLEGYRERDCDIIKADISKSGEFFFEVYGSDYFQKGSQIVHENIHGEIHYIGNVIIEEMNLLILICRATNYKNVFKVNRTEGIEFLNVTGQVKLKEKEEFTNRFSIRFTDTNLAKKAKNAIDYLAVHFGRKEDAF